MISLSIILIGFTAMASQIIYMRELLVVFYGNELSISFILAGWLIGGAIGSLFLGRFADRIRSKVTVFSFCQIAIGILLPSGIVAARLIKSALHVNPGEIIPLFPIIISSFLILAPLCILLGFMFSIGCCIRPGAGRPRAGTAIGNVYILEAVGSIIGGAITSLILIKFLDSIHITAIFAALNIIAAFFLAIFSKETRAKTLLAAFALIFIAAGAVLWMLGGFDRIDRYSLDRQWQGYDLIASKNSIYGNIAIVKKEENFSFFDNGLHLYTIPDKLNCEEAAHLALLEHPDPQNILLIGGGAGGLVEEMLKEPVKKIDYVELDPMIINMAEKYLPDTYYNALKDPRVSIKNIDGRFFVKTTKEKYDCIIIRAGDPYTAQINRYYTVEFYKEAKNILKKGGIVSFGLASSESYISRSLKEFLASVYFTLKSVFTDVLIMPGDTAYFIASDEKGYLTYDHRLLEERIRERRLDTQYVREYYLFSKLSPGKLLYISNVIEDKKDVKINYDFRPTSYYYGLIFWTTLFRESAFSKILRSANEDVIWQAIGFFILLLAFMSIVYKRSFKRTSLIAVMAGGFSTMAFQVTILLAFQTLHGYLFYKLGLILTSFMAGLAIGAFFAVKIMQRTDRERLLLISIQGDFFLFSLILPVFFLKAGSSALFPVMSAIAGFIGGSQFPIVNKVFLGNSGETGRVGGVTYGIDLFGSFLGAIVTGIFFIPILGIQRTCLALALINLAILGLLVLNVSLEE